MRFVCQLVTLAVCALTAPVVAQGVTGAVRVEVRSDKGPMPGATVTVGDQSAVTDPSGVAIVTSRVGVLRLVVQLQGFLDATEEIFVEADRGRLVVVTLVEAPEVHEEVVVVASTRTGRRLEDQPTRVEVLDREEIEEKMLMTPGDIVMMLNEMGGLRVQATSPSIGAAACACRA